MVFKKASVVVWVFCLSVLFCFILFLTYLVEFLHVPFLMAAQGINSYSNS